jgi:hypothetical protein
VATLASLNEVFEHANKTEQSCFIGIDPGKTGAMGVICGEVVAAFDIPIFKAKSGKKRKSEFDLLAIRSMFRRSYLCNDLTYCAVEKPPPGFGFKGPTKRSKKGTDYRPGQGTPYSQFQLGCSYAMWPLFLVSKGFRVTEVAPHAWKRVMRVPGKDKEVGRHAALKMFPDAEVFLSRKKDHNRAESLLLADYIRRLHAGEKK